MKYFKLSLAAVGLLILSLVLLQPVKAGLSSQQAQIGVTIVVIVSPTPLAYNERSTTTVAQAPVITSSMSLDRATPALKHVFDAQSLQFEQTSSLVVAQVQHPLLVQAAVSPNPNATLLTSNNTEVVINASPGTTLQVPCAFTVTVSTTTSWSLDEGLTNDFSSSFPGKDLANNTYASTPLPTSTPYLVYADDGSAWSLLASGSKITTYCVTLTVTVPASVTAGTYSSNAIYTLFMS
ncbi:MAG TPA: hypothetical protein VMF11_06250 [Candidatus Baltobacteraceae bacterium]|nr:hypothetical protein [Candidatus Baltobacteraceae bacterium]